MAYSTSGRTRVKYAFSMMAVAPVFRFRRRKPIVLFALSHQLAVGYVVCHSEYFAEFRPTLLISLRSPRVMHIRPTVDRKYT